MLWLDPLTDLIGENQALALGGGVIGIAFGIFAQRSRFCLRSATLEAAQRQPGEKLAVWLLVFASALLATQCLIIMGWFDTGTVRQLNNRGSLSGAIVGGLIFGCGMTLTRACGSRMIVLSASGNLRTLLAGLIFALVAQLSLSGVLMPFRSALNDAWTIDSTARDILVNFKMSHLQAAFFSLLWLLLGAGLAYYRRMSLRQCFFAIAVGLTVALAWFFNYDMSTHLFEVAPVHALTFASPSADALMYLLDPQGHALNFDLGLIPGVFLGSFLAAWLSREFQIVGFENGANIPRYVLGGAFMGFGAIEAGGCAVGAGVSGASVFSATAWIVLWSMWIGAVITDRFIDSANAKSQHTPR